jgi:uncharacterized membrane protein YkoI
MRILLTFAVVLSLAAFARADEEKVSLDKLPAAVKDAYAKLYPGATFKRASTEKEEGKTVYEVSFTHKGANLDVTFDGTGAILGIEKEIAAKDLPKVVADAVAAKYPGATLKKAEELAKADGKPSAYEVLLVTAAKETVEVRLDLAGKITEEEKKGK